MKALTIACACTVTHQEGAHTVLLYAPQMLWVPEMISLAHSALPAIFLFLLCRT